MIVRYIYVLAYLVIVTPYSWAAPDLKFPFPPGELWRLNRAYNNDTHVGKDFYALDFGLPNCQAWHMPALAVASGIAYIRGNKDNTSSYGLYVDIDHGDGYVSRYAHLDDTTITNGWWVRQGQQIGKIGNSGHVISSATCDHPGTHLHFALYHDNGAYKPEPLDGQSDFTESKFYNSTNIDYWTTSDFFETDSFCKVYNPNPLVERFRNASTGSIVINMTPSDGKIYYYSNHPQCDLSYYTFYYADDVGGSESSGTPPIIGSDNSGSLPDIIPNRVWLTNNAQTQEQYNFHINEAFKMKLQSKNIGDKDSLSGMSIAFYYSNGLKIDNNPDPVGTDEVDISNLTVQKTNTETEGLIASKYPGDYNIVGCVDTGKKITEKKENNNCSSEVVYTVWSNPNLSVSNLALSGGKISLQKQEPYSVDATILNAGENFGKTVMIAYYLNDALIGTDRIQRENLLGGQSKIETLHDVIAPSIPGIYTLKVCVDYDSRIFETNETDNCNTVNFDVQSSDYSSTGAVMSIITDLLLTGNELTSVIKGNGIVTSTPAGIKCPDACTENFNNQKVTLTAKPKTGNVFVGWSAGCKLSVVKSVCVLNLTNDKTITATFQKTP